MNNANDTKSTFSTSEQSLILVSGPYCGICLQPTHIISTCSYIKNRAESAQTRTKGIKRVLAPKPTARHRSQNCSPRRNRFGRFAQRDQNQSTPLTQPLYNNREIRTCQPPSNPASKLITTSELKLSRAWGWILLLSKVVSPSTTNFCILRARKMRHHRISLLLMLNHPSIFATMLRQNCLPKLPALSYF